MAKAKKLVVAVFEKPTDCRGCPCSNISPGYRVDICQLANKRIEFPVTKDVPIPDWCPLTDVKFVPG